MPYESLSRIRITQALRRLGELAQAQKVTLEISLYGGAAFTLVYGSRDATKDVDAVVRPSELAGKLGRKVAAELGLPEDWLNDDVKQFLADKEAKRILPEDEFGPGLRISVPTAAYLLAMKLRACRPPLPGYAGDYGDIRFLVGKMGLKSVAEAEKIHDKFFPHDELPAAAREVVKKRVAVVRQMTTRPKSLREVAARSDSLDEFGRHLRDWLHELRRFSSRAQAAAAIAAEPPLLHGKFPEAHTADAWLGAYAEHLSRKLGRAAPVWAFAPGRIAPDPTFDRDAETPKLRTLAVLHSPAAFKRRNLFTPSVDLPLRLRAGRPAKSPEEKRKTNAERQRRFRLVRHEELVALRKLQRKHALRK